MAHHTGSFHITPWRVFYILIMAACLILIVRQYGGWNLDEALAAYRQKIELLKPGDDEQNILTHFTRVQSLNKPYTIGVVAITDHTPTFGGALYRVYDIGFYDFDRRVRHLMHIICEKDRIRTLTGDIPGKRR